MTGEPASGAVQAATWSRSLEGRAPAEIVAWADAQFGEGLVIGSSFGRDGLVVLDLARRLRPTIRVLFLETGYHFPETLRFRDRIRAQWQAHIVDVRPSQTPEEQAATYGPELYARDPDRCCELRKVAPLRSALRGTKAWLTGLRRSQHPGRRTTPVVEWQDLGDGRGGVYKVNPLAAWSLEEVEAYLNAHDVPRHPLWAAGYPSVGCAPCTVPVASGEPERAGRWRGRDKSECGIHLAGIAPTRAAPCGA